MGSVGNEVGRAFARFGNALAMEARPKRALERQRENAAGRCKNGRPCSRAAMNLLSSSVEQPCYILLSHDLQICQSTTGSAHPTTLSHPDFRRAFPSKRPHSLLLQARSTHPTLRPPAGIQWSAIRNATGALLLLAPVTLITLQPVQLLSFQTSTFSPAAPADARNSAVTCIVPGHQSQIKLQSAQRHSCN